ncbi:MAG: ATP synthase subunit C [Parachlamydiaceae bacterium]|nr:ATP synthase subunit C [Parachlamydiaceae bacterium]
MDYNMVGPAISLGLSCMGCCVGCWIAGSAAHAAMSRTEEGHGKFIGMSAAPSSQSIYGFLLMLQMKRAILAGTLSPESAIAIGLFSGGAFVFSSIYQGKVCATGIQATLRQPSVYGKCFAAIGIIESFALFAFVFALLIM